MCCKLSVFGEHHVMEEGLARGLTGEMREIMRSTHGVTIEFVPADPAMAMDRPAVYFALKGAGHRVTPESWVYAVKAAVSFYDVTRELGPVELMHQGVPCDTKSIGVGGPADLRGLCWVGAPAGLRKAEAVQDRTHYVRTYDGDARFACGRHG